jgi:hypothetical protein
MSSTAVRRPAPLGRKVRLVLRALLVPLALPGPLGRRVLMALLVLRALRAIQARLVMATLDLLVPLGLLGPRATVVRVAIVEHQASAPRSASAGSRSTLRRTRHAFS